MKFFMDFTEMWIGNVSVNLGGRDVGVAEHSLNRAKISAIHEKISGKRVTEGVRRDVLSDAG